MAITTVATFLGTDPEHRTHLAYAAQLCAQHNAHLTGNLLLRLDFLDRHPSSYIRGAVAIAEMLRHQKERDRETILAAQEHLSATAGRHGVRHEFRVHMASADIDELLPGALHADLVIATTASVSWPDGLPPPDAMQLTTGVPFLLMPEKWADDRMPRNILIAWKAGRESRRAIGDALPLLQRATSVTLFMVDPPAGEASGIEAATFLARHGVKLTVEAVQSQGRAVAEVVAAHALARDQDLIVIGAYSHRRSTEIVLGGVTRSLVLHAPVPLLIAH